MKTQTLQNDILMRSIKIVDIGYINAINASLAIIFAQLVDKIMGKFDEKTDEKKSILILTIEFICIFWLYGIIIYIARNIVNSIPFPLDGYEGYDHMRLKELNMPLIFSFTFILFCSFVKEKTAYFYKRLSSKN